MGTDRPKESAPPPPKTEWEEGEDDQEDRPTVRPNFDPAELAKGMVDNAREPRRPTPLGVPGIPPDAYRKAQATLSNEAELERARLESAARSDTPPTAQAESTRTSLLSMADAREPSEPPAAKRPTSGGPILRTESFSEIDKAWEDLDLDEPMSDEPPTRPTAQAEVAKPAAEARRPSGRMKAPSGEHLFTRKDAAEVQVIAPAPDKKPEKKPQKKEQKKEASPPADTREPVSPGTSPRSNKNDPLRMTTPGVGSYIEASAKESPAPAPGPLTFDAQIGEMRDRFSLGDYTGALVLAEGLLEDAPDDAEVRECAENCRQVLRQMYTARLGPLDRVPVVTVARDQLRWLSIDHRAGFVLSHVDGVSSLEMILDVSGMPLLDALRILCELAQQRIISFR